MDDLGLIRKKKSVAVATSRQLRMLELFVLFIFFYFFKNLRKLNLWAKEVSSQSRSQGDVVSLLGARAKHSKTLNHGNFLSRNKHAIAGALTLNPIAFGIGLVSDAVRNHDVDNIKNEKYLFREQL